MLFAAAYSQLPSIFGGRLLCPLPEDAPCRGDKELTPGKMVNTSKYLHGNLCVSKVQSGHKLFATFQIISFRDIGKRTALFERTAKKSF
jgi:hypothetical protein